MVPHSYIHNWYSLPECALLVFASLPAPKTRNQKTTKLPSGQDGSWKYHVSSLPPNNLVPVLHRRSRSCTHTSLSGSISLLQEHHGTKLTCSTSDEKFLSILLPFLQSHYCTVRLLDSKGHSNSTLSVCTWWNQQAFHLTLNFSYWF